MSQLIKILIPIIPIDNLKLFFKGFVQMKDKECLTIFITHFSYKNIFESENMNANIIYGYRSLNVERRDFQPQYESKRYNNIVLDKHNNLQSLIIDGVERSNDVNCIIILYDYNKVRNSETIGFSKDSFSILHDLINNEITESSNQTKSNSILETPSWLVCSMFAQHVYNYFNILRWLLNTVRKKVSIKHGNLILAIIVDILLGYLILQILIFAKKDLGALLLGILEKLVHSMYSLLKWLMGAPAGLKLNKAFNNMLGKYFLYHVELWWLFLDISGEKLDIVINIYQYLGYLGLTFQAAIISDMICLATFHSYCIYVYAARLFNIQISGLIALLRLFVGRKYNPLRGGIDSCEYSNQELFVGTVAFTILLLLLPTTLMYYTVFTMFRVLSLMVQYILAKVIYILQTLPLYVVALWLTHSPKIAGNILIEEVTSNNTTLFLEMKLFNNSFQDLMKTFRPPVKEPKQVEWSKIISNVFTGKQII